MGFNTIFFKEYNFHYTHAKGKLGAVDILDEAKNIISNRKFVKNMDAIWDLRFADFPNNADKIEMIKNFALGAKELSPLKGKFYKTAIIVDSIEKNIDLSSYIVIGKEINLEFNINIFNDLIESLNWLEIDKKDIKKIVNEIIND